MKSGPQVGLVLSGGGARGAYQAGVLQAISEICVENKIARPFCNIAGVSAGAINAAYLACMIDQLPEACLHMSQLWTHLYAKDVFRTDAFSAGRSGFLLAFDAAFGALYSKKLARSLLDTTPLRTLLAAKIPFDRLPQMIAEDRLDALAITAMNYASANSVTFVQGNQSTPMWTRARRYSVLAQLGTDHVMASSAIPLFFPPVAVDKGHYGDGCLRNTAPLSPSIHLGANKLMVISVRRPDSLGTTEANNIEPTFARVLGVILNALLLDAVEIDMERLSRINTTIEAISEEGRKPLGLKKVDYLWLRPSQDIGHLAADGFEGLPPVIKYLLRGLGSSKEASEVTSYLLFDPAFCTQLVAIGYKDGMANKEDILNFLTTP